MVAFGRCDGFPGKIYLPEKNAPGPAKHPCADCYSCQMCGDDRCALCRIRPDGGTGPDAERPAAETGK